MNNNTTDTVDISKDLYHIDNHVVTGEVVALKPQPNTITFSLDYPSGSDGELYLENNTMKFRGDVDKSAKVLFNAVCEMWNVKIGETP